MSSEIDEREVRKNPAPQSGYLRVLEQLLNEDNLRALQTAALDSADASLSICHSTSADDATTLCFVVNTPSEVDFPALGEQIEDILDYPDIKIVRQHSEPALQFNQRYKNLTLLAPDNRTNITAFINHAEDPSKKHKK
jgi:hypothetical protein